MKYIVYLTVNKVNNYIYIGVHKVHSDKFDGYLGNGVYATKPSTYMNAKTPFEKAVKKYGVKNFVRTTIKEFDNIDDAFALEKELVNADFVKRLDVYNLSEGGKVVNNVRTLKAVHMYTREGQYELSFESIAAAAKFLGNKNAEKRISKVVDTHVLCMGHQFLSKKPYKAKDRTPKKLRPVGRYDDDGNLLETFESVAAAIHAGYENARKCVKGLRKHCNGFVFKYLD